MSSSTESSNLHDFQRIGLIYSELNEDYQLTRLSTSTIKRLKSPVSLGVHSKLRNELEPLETSWKYWERAGATWSYLEQGGTACNEMDSATN